eukprot:979374-Prymnesium_polylepis.1
MLGARRIACVLCVCASSSLDSTRLRQPADALKAELRQRIYEISGRTVSLQTLQRLDLENLYALSAIYSHIARGEAVIVVHAHHSLPRRLLSLCSAA